MADNCFRNRTSEDGIVPRAYVQEKQKDFGSCALLVEFGPRSPNL
jgi:hypothetical protein